MSQLKQYEKTASIFKALAHPARLLVVDQLQKGELCVCDLQSMIGLDVSTVSKHLAILRNLGIVSVRKEKNFVYYSLELDCLCGVINCLERDNNPEAAGCKQCRGTHV
ncbi:MAG: ArsR/SmtB family transcription factor [Desulfovibrio sp.]